MIKSKYFPLQAFAWQAREWLRRKLVGQMVTFVKEFSTSSTREHGKIYLGGTCQLLFNLVLLSMMISRN